MNIFSPAAIVGFFEQLSDAESRGEATLELLGQIAESHEMEIVGPVPGTIFEGPAVARCIGR